MFLRLSIAAMTTGAPKTAVIVLMRKDIYTVLFRRLRLQMLQQFRQEIL